MLQELIKKIELRRDNLIDMAQKQKALSDTTYYSLIDKASEANEIIMLIINHKPQFEECIKKAYLEGALSQISTDNKNVTPQDYYNQNYNHE